MPNQKLTKRVVDAAEPRASRYTIFDTAIPGFGLRVFPSGAKSWVYDYRPGEGGRSTIKKRVTLGTAFDPKGAQPDLTADRARQLCEKMRAIVINGGDPQGAIQAKRDAPTVETLAKTFMSDHVALKRAASTATYYQDILDRLILPEFGKVKAEALTPADVARLHRKLKDRPFLANRMLAVLGAMYGYGAGAGHMLPRDTNPTVGIEKFEEPKRERLLSADELERLGTALRLAETEGLPWELNPDAKHKHLPKSGAATKLSPHAVAAIRLLLLTGARLREILNLRWDQVDFDRGLLLLKQHKTSRKTGAKAIVLNAPALETLKKIERIGVYVIAGESAGKEDEKPRSDLKRPWAMVTKHAGLSGLRIHDLRHNFASFGVGGGMGLPVIGKLLGHTQAVTTSRYAHLDNDPLKRATNTIGSRIVAAMEGQKPGNVTELEPRRRTRKSV